ncbi:hypothetical protein GCM10008096_26320 [Zhihengliuella salsuginis]|uniref:ABC transporter n=2 Tax=Zhihengliuella salsuginis TaxID=578222 RepID=A0ABQ3GKH1_9MICC|nr:hypothetical protein GCM10008096_26320 [Zhihengliuella salsuginis]
MALPGESVGILGSRRDGAQLVTELVAGSKDPEQGKIYIDGDPVVLDAPGAFLSEETLRFNAVRFAMAHGMSGQRVRSAVAIVAQEAALDDAVFDDQVRNIDHQTVERVRFYLALATGTKALVIDDSEVLFELLQNEWEQKKVEAFYGRGGSMILVSNDIRHLSPLAGRICWLHEGNFIMDAETATVKRWRTQLAKAEREKDTKRAGQLVRRFQAEYEPPALSLRGNARRRTT